MFDLAEVEWVPLNEVRLEDQERIIQAMDSLNVFLKNIWKKKTSKFQFCLRNKVIAVDLVVRYQFSSYYTSVPVEFQLREFYRSQLPFLPIGFWNMLRNPRKKTVSRD